MQEKKKEKKNMKILQHFLRYISKSRSTTPTILKVQTVQSNGLLNHTAHINTIIKQFVLNKIINTMVKKYSEKDHTKISKKNM